MRCGTGHCLSPQGEFGRVPQRILSLAPILRLHRRQNIKVLKYLKQNLAEFGNIAVFQAYVRNIAVTFGAYLVH